MKRVCLISLFVLAVSLVMFVSCIGGGTYVSPDPIFLYNIELNIQNESSSSKSIMSEAYTLYDSDKEACKLFDLDTLTVAAGSSDSFVQTVSQGLCGFPHLSHIMKIDGKCFSGFDTESFVLKDSDNSDLQGKISALKTNLGSVDWTQGKKTVVNYDGKSFTADENSSKIKLVYSIILKDEADIPESEKDEYVEGIKISVSHRIE